MFDNEKIPSLSLIKCKLFFAKSSKLLYIKPKQNIGKKGSLQIIAHFIQVLGYAMLQGRAIVIYHILTLLWNDISG